MDKVNSEIKLSEDVRKKIFEWVFTQIITFESLLIKNQ